MAKYSRAAVRKKVHPGIQSTGWVRNQLHTTDWKSTMMFVLKWNHTWHETPYWRNAGSGFPVNMMWQVLRLLWLQKYFSYKCMILFIVAGSLLDFILLMKVMRKKQFGTSGITYSGIMWKGFQPDYKKVSIASWNYTDKQTDISSFQVS